LLDALPSFQHRFTALRAATDFFLIFHEQRSETPLRLAKPIVGKNH
jgi:hypothetical protein